jgi:hypothetical protein
MRPEDVPAEIIETAERAANTAPQKRNNQPTRMRYALAAAWPAIEAMVREQVAAQIMADVDHLIDARREGGMWEAAYRAARIARQPTEPHRPQDGPHAPEAGL